MAIAPIITTPNDFSPSAPGTWSPLPAQRPLLLVGHGSRDARGARSRARICRRLPGARYLSPSDSLLFRADEPTIQDGVDQCVEKGYTDISVLPILLFAARHNKFDVTNELDRARQRHPQVTFHYGRHFGITPAIIQLWQERLEELDTPPLTPGHCPRRYGAAVCGPRGQRPRRQRRCL
jgi:sirohydrochlorin cobaltochelatase